MTLTYFCNNYMDLKENFQNHNLGAFLFFSFGTLPVCALPL